MRTKGLGESGLLLLDAVEVLEQVGSRYAVIGAMAASVHGVVRASMDADAVVSAPSHSLHELERAFRRAGFAAELRHGEDGDPIAAVLALSDTYGNRVDLLAGLRGLDPAAFSRVVEVPFHGVLLRVVSREDFIAMKLYAGRPLDLTDARRALAAGRELIDMDLLRRAADAYGAATSAALDRLLEEVFEGAEPGRAERPGSA